MTTESNKIGSARAAVVYRALRHAIIEQALQPGAKLPEDAIGEKFAVSRTLVRAALGQLAAEGLVELRANRGASVAKPNWDEAQDMFDVRMGLERIVMRRLAGQLSKDQIAQLRAHVISENRARNRNEPLSIRLAGEFHILLAKLTGSEIISRYVSEVTSRSGLILALYGRPHSSDCGVTEHEAIVDALVSAEPGKAMELMETHLRAVADRALIQPHSQRRRELDDVLAAYAAQSAAPKSLQRPRRKPK